MTQQNGSCKKCLTTMTNRAGATNAQMAPFFSDSQQLRKQEWKKQKSLCVPFQIKVHTAVM